MADFGDRSQEQKDFGVLLENVPVIDVFIAMQTQWRALAGYGGVFWQGLDYSVLPWVMQQCGVKKSDVPDVFEMVRIAEVEAVKLFNAKA